MPMTPRERLARVLRHEKPDRLPIIEWAVWWDKTIRRWESEGLPAGLSGEAIRARFGQDKWLQRWLGAIGPGAPSPPRHGAAIVANLREYEKILPFLYHDIDLTFFREHRKEHESGEAVIWITIEGFFWFPRALLGIEPHLTSFYDAPELCHRVCRDALAWIDRALDAVTGVLTPDFLTFAEDMSYNLGPMIGKDTFDEFLAPYYRVILRKLKSAGIPVILDSDGDVTRCLPWYLDVGMDGILPLERQSGVDINLLQQATPGAVFLGAYDKMSLTAGEPAMRAEFERLLPAMRRGGFIPSVDHQTPPGVSLREYEIYMELLREYAVKGVYTP